MRPSAGFAREYSIADVARIFLPHASCLRRANDRELALSEKLHRLLIQPPASSSVFMPISGSTPQALHQSI